MKTGEPFYGEIDDSSPPNADLTLLTNGRTSNRWNEEYPQFIDQMALSQRRRPWAADGSFAQLVYDATDAPFKSKLSDHCMSRLSSSLLVLEVAFLRIPTRTYWGALCRRSNWCSTPTRLIPRGANLPLKLTNFRAGSSYVQSAAETYPANAGS
jgi:hypothetical protein